MKNSEWLLIILLYELSDQTYELCSDKLYREDSCPPCPSNTFNWERIDTSLPYYQIQRSNVCKNATEICVTTACPKEGEYNKEL